MLRSNVKSILWVFIACLVFFWLFYPRIENSFVFHPDKSFRVCPAQLGLFAQNIHFQARDGVRLHGWFFKGRKKGPVMLFCHGNAGNISHRLENIKAILKHGFSVFIFDYRGYGKSAGNPSEQGIYSDGLAAYDYLVNEQHISLERIVLFGRSLGAAVATHIALHQKACLLVLESGFTSTKDMAKTMGPFALLSPFLPAHYHNLAKVPHIPIPKLIIHGNRDEIIPFSMGKRLYEAAAGPKTFYPLSGAGHNDTWIVGGNRYFQTLEDFAGRCSN